MKKLPFSGCVEYWSELTMFAPCSNRKRETAATIPGPSGQEINSRAVSLAMAVTRYARAAARRSTELYAAASVTIRLAVDRARLILDLLRRRTHLQLRR